MKLKEYLKLSYNPICAGIVKMSLPRPALICKDGFEVSVQAGEYLYCHPRQDDCDYDEVEIGFMKPFDKWIVDELNKGYTNKSLSEEDVYGYVPIGMVDELLEKHGGIDEDKMLTLLTMEELIDEP